METGTTVGHYRFEAWDLPTKYGWMHSGPGVQAATEAQDAARRMAARLIESGRFVSRVLNGAQWAGAAATAAGEAMQRGAGQITQTAAEAATAQRCVTELGESFQTAQHRVPSPNELPSGLGDTFLYGAAEGFNALSPFDVQSPLHDALEQRRELDQQANLALTDHMTTSRERVAAIPAVAAPEPIVPAGSSAGGAGTAGSVGGVGLPAGGAPAVGGSGAAPVVTTAAGWTPAPVAPPAGVGAGVDGPPGVGTSPPGTRVVGPAGGVPYAAQPGAFPPIGAGAGAGPGVAAFGPGSVGQAGAGGRPGAGLRGGAGLGVRSGVRGDDVPSRGVPGRDVPVGGPVTPGSRGGGGGNRTGVGSFLQPPVGGRSSDDGDTEHQDRYAQQDDHIVGELPLVAPAVIGETPEEEHRRLGRNRR